MHYLLTHLDDAWALTKVHLRLSLVPVLIGLAIAVPLGVLVQRAPIRATTDDGNRQRRIHRAVAGAVRGLADDHRNPDPRRGQRHGGAERPTPRRCWCARCSRRWTQCRSRYGTPPIAVGYPPLNRMLKVELPLSIPVLVAGLRVVVVTNIAMVAVGSVIGIGGLGTWFTDGYQTNKSDQIFAGIIALFVIAIVIDMLIDLAGRLATPWQRAAREGQRDHSRSIVAPIVGGAR